mgnify:CR=1 FL=1|jgi:type I restriction enzyme S subunit
MELQELCSYVKTKVETSNYSIEDYISTENMLPEKGGITIASSFPSGKVTEFQENDILISNIRPYFKKIWRANRSGCCSNDVLCIRANNNVDAEFLYYLLSQDLFFAYVMSGANGSKMPRGDKQQIMNWEIEIPSEKEDQRRIASILSSLDRKIELNNKINADLEEMAQAIFKNWFVDFEPFKDGKFVDSELGMIPEGWKVGTLGDITNNKSAKVKERNDVKVLSPVTSGELVLSEEYFTKQVFSSSIAKYKIVNKGDFAYNPARVNIGSLGRNEFDFYGCVSPVYVVFSVLEGYENYFDLFRKTDFFKDSVASLAIGGVRQSLSYDDLSLIETIIPSKNIVEKFNNLYNQMKKTIKANKLENSRLSLLRDTLLPRLMSGELEVPE